MVSICVLSRTDTRQSRYFSSNHHQINQSNYFCTWHEGRGRGAKAPRTIVAAHWFIAIAVLLPNFVRIFGSGSCQLEKGKEQFFLSEIEECSRPARFQLTSPT
jgi:hypothetical protein